MMTESEARAAIIAEGRTWINAVYQFGGCTKAGVDCSCLTLRCYEAAGLTLPRTSQDQWSVCDPIIGADAKPGDLVFFNDTYPGPNPTHVALYWSSGQMLSASSESRPVGIEAIWTSYPMSYGRPKVLSALNGGQPPPMTIVVNDLRGTLPAKPEYGAYDTRPASAITTSVIHYTAGSYIDTPQSVAAYQTSSAAAEQTGTGMPFPEIAYHLFVKADGTIYLCNSLTEETWHAKSANSYSVSICFACPPGFDPKTAQIAGMARAHVWCEQQLGRQLSVVGHKSVPGNATTCPGVGWGAWQQKLLAEIEVVRKAETTTGPTFLPGSGMPAYLAAHPEIGPARTNEVLGPDGSLSYLWTKHPQNKGSLVLWRAYTGEVTHHIFDKLKP